MSHPGPEHAPNPGACHGRAHAGTDASANHGRANPAPVPISNPEPNRCSDRCSDDFAVVVSNPDPQRGPGNIVPDPKADAFPHPKADAGAHAGANRPDDPAVVRSRPVGGCARDRRG